MHTYGALLENRTIQHSQSRSDVRTSSRRRCSVVSAPRVGVLRDVARGAQEKTRRGRARGAVDRGGHGRGRGDQQAAGAWRWVGSSYHSIYFVHYQTGGPLISRVKLARGTKKISSRMRRGTRRIFRNFLKKNTVRSRPGAN